MAGGYRFVKVKQGALKTVPDKNDPEGFSHVADCLQYVCLMVIGNLMPYIARVLRPKGERKSKRVSPRAWT